MSDAAVDAPPGLSGRELSKFERVLGRQPTEAEKLQLFRLKDTLGLADNDEVWTFVVVLQHFEWLYERHPAQIEEAFKRSVAEIERAAAEAVKVEVGRARGLLENAVASAASSMATARAAASQNLARWWVGAGLTLFAGFALVCGFELGRGGLPFWMRREVALDGGALAKVAGAVLGAPAGWLALLLLVPVCWFWVKHAWVTARDGAESFPRRVRAWSIVSGAAAVWVAGLVAVAWLAGSLFGGHPEQNQTGRRATRGFAAAATQHDPRPPTI